MALRDQPYLPLYVQDFLTDEKLVECSAESTGVYIRIMCLMHKSEDYGKLLLKQKHKQTDDQTKNFALMLARHLPYKVAEIEKSITELLDEGVLFSDGDFLCQKRMIKDGEISLKRAESGKKGGDKSLGKKEKQPKKFAQAKPKANSQANSENEIEIEYDNENEIKDENGNGNEESHEEITLTFPWSNDRFSQIWERWKTFRKKQHNFEYKSIDSEQAALNELCNLVHGDMETAIASLVRTMSEGWKGFKYGYQEIMKDGNNKDKSAADLEQEILGRFKQKYGTANAQTSTHV